MIELILALAIIATVFHLQLLSRQLRQLDRDVEAIRQYLRRRHEGTIRSL